MASAQHTRRDFLGRAIGVAGAASAVPLLGAASAGAAETPPHDPDRPLALTHATVIDGTDAPPVRDATVLIVGGRIVAVDRTTALAPPPGARVVDLTGKYVIPGLIESHVHSVGPEAVIPPLYALTGVTTVREMRGEPYHHVWREKIRRGELLGPRWVIGSAIVDGTPSLHIHETGSLIEVDDERSGREAVRQVVRDGADFVKVYSRLTPDTYRAIAHESRRLGIAFAGHCPDRVSPAEACDLGQASIEHMYPIVLATSTREAEIRRELAEVRVDPTDTDPVSRYSDWFRQIHPLEYETVTGHDPRRADALFARFVAHHTRVVPTLAVHRTLELPDENPRSDDTWKYLPSWIVEDWPRQMSIVVDDRTPEQARRIREIHAHRRRLVGRMFRAGVPVLAGTDTGNPYLAPGFALHRELELLVACGLSPLRALQAATREPAALLGAGSTLGTVEPGRLADLVVLDADPLRDIRNTTAIHAVVVDGRLIDGARRSALLAEVEHAASTTPPPAPGAAPIAGCGCGAH